MQIKFEVTKYILDQKGTIPFASKIITRVFQNFKQIILSRDTPSKRKRRNVHQQQDMGAFAIQFTEKLPLFDFFDAGRGKERVDDKIRGNSVSMSKHGAMLITCHRTLPFVPLTAQLLCHLSCRLSRQRVCTHA